MSEINSFSEYTGKYNIYRDYSYLLSSMTANISAALRSKKSD